MDSSQSNSGRQTDDKAATSMDSSQPKRGFGRPKQTKEEAATSRERQRQKRKERDAAQKAEGSTAYEQRRATALPKKKRRAAAKRSALKQEGGAPYEDAKKKDALRKTPAPFHSVDQKAADQGDAEGDAEAQFSKGLAYEEGRGVEKSDKGAVLWYRQAANQGDADAQFFMGFAYENGQGVQQSDEGAVQWYRQAANQGDADAAQVCLEVEAAIAAVEA